MKKNLLFLSLILFCIQNLYSQNANEPASFNSLQAPSSPGFILLDQTPSAIERPTTSQGFAISALNLFQGGALEISPFWLKLHPNLVAGDLRQNNGLYARSLSISMATVNLDSGKYITAGLRSRLFQKYSTIQSANITSKLNQIVAELSNGLNTNWENAQKLKNEYADLMLKPTFSLDLALAVAGNSKTMTANTVDISRAAAWLAFNWRPKGDDFYVTLLTRYLNNVNFEAQSKNQQIGDFGCRINYDVNLFCISAEYLQRMNFTTANYATNRLAIVTSYQVMENLYFTGTFGKNYSGVNNLITMIGINLGHSNNKIKAF